MPTTQEIVNSIIAQAKALDPAASFEVGTPERLIVEANAEQISSAIVDFQVLGNQHDLDAMTGSRLDSFLSVFAFGRQQPTVATGTVTFSRATAALDDITIPRGTQVVARPSDVGFAAIVFSTTGTAVLQVGQTSVSVGIEAALPGTVGNLSAGTINAFGGTQPVPGISTISNNTATTGGIDGETDAELKVRFKNTAFRNVSGTTDQYLALSVSRPYTTKANVVGALSRYLEYVQTPSSNDVTQVRPVIDARADIFPHKRTTAPSTIPFSKFTYNHNFHLSNGEYGETAIFYRPNLDYVFNNPLWLDGDAVGQAASFGKKQPNITVLDPNLSPTANVDDPTNLTIKPGQVLLMEHAYISKNSRNDYLAGILNCIDIFVDGQNVQNVTSREIMPGAAYAFVRSPETVLTFNKNYRRLIDGTHPAEGNRLHVLAWQPMIDVPDYIDVGTNRYYKAKYVKYDGAGVVLSYHYDAALSSDTVAHYWAIYEDTDLFGTIRARSGIEWSAVTNGKPIDTSSDQPASPQLATAWGGTQFSIANYTYDANIADLQAIMENHEQVATDVLVHQAKIRYFKLYITVMYAAGTSTPVVNQNIVAALQAFFARQYFGSVVQMSDLLQAIHNVAGVDNVRWSSELDGALPKAAEVQRNGITLNDDLGAPITFSGDFFLQDSELPALPDITSGNINTALVIKKRAQNTWNLA